MPNPIITLNRKKIKESISWIQDKKEGPYEEYYKNGQLKTLGYFTKGRKEGTFEYYKENGNLVKTEDF